MRQTQVHGSRETGRTVTGNRIPPRKRRHAKDQPITPVEARDNAAKYGPVAFLDDPARKGVFASYASRPLYGVVKYMGYVPASIDVFRPQQLQDLGAPRLQAPHERLSPDFDLTADEADVKAQVSAQETAVTRNAQSTGSGERFLAALRRRRFGGANLPGG